MSLDDQLAKAGFVTISERMRCDGPMDGMMRHANVETLDDLLEWVELTRREILGMIARHDLEIHELGDDIADFIYGKSAILWEMHVNLLHVMKGMKDGIQRQAGTDGVPS